MRKGKNLERIISCRLRRIASWLVAAGLSLFSRLTTTAADGWEGHILGLTWDNDATYGTDRHYTQGAQLTYLSADHAVPRWIEKASDTLPSVGFDVAARKWGIDIGQQIHTPEDLNASEVIQDDRPYAAWLFAGVKLQRRGPGAWGWPVIETIGLEGGVIGPEAIGRDAQQIVHRTEPAGWRNQLQTEPGAILRYDRRHLYRHHFGPEWRFDVIPHAALAAGNILTFVSLGAMGRWGYEVPNEFIANDEQLPRYGFYCFAGVEGRAVARNIFVEGNTFRTSHRLDKEPLVGDFRAGLTLVLKKFEVTVSQTIRSREFEGQKRADSFGTFTLLYKF